jgi:hypothetical protein
MTLKLQTYRLRSDETASWSPLPITLSPQTLSTMHTYVIKYHTAVTQMSSECVKYNDMNPLSQETNMDPTILTQLFTCGTLNNNMFSNNSRSEDDLKQKIQNVGVWYQYMLLSSTINFDRNALIFNLQARWRSRYSDSLWAENSGDWIPAGARIFAFFQMGPETQPSPCAMGNRFITGG